MRWLLLILSSVACVHSFVSQFPHVSLKHRYMGNSQELLAAKHDINMPALSSTMKEGKIVSWNKKVGDKVNAGDVLLVVESDKADMDVESFEDGYLAAIHTPEGSSALVGSAVATLVSNKEDIGSIGSTASTPVISNAPQPAVSKPVTVTPSTPVKSAGSSPKFEQILMPALSSTMKEGKIVSWSKKVGDRIAAGDMVLVVESDKADMDVESYEDGFLAAIAVADGQVAQVGNAVGYIVKTKEEIPTVQAFIAGGGKKDTGSSEIVSASAQAVSAPKTSVTETNSGHSSASAPVVNTGRVAASGYAQTQAKALGIDLHTVTPSRSDRYIVASDLATGGSSGSSAAASISSSSSHVSAPGVINATPTARKAAADNNLDISKIKGTGNFNRVTQEDVLRAAGKLPPVVEKATESAAKPITAPVKASTSPVVSASSVLEGTKAMDGMQKAVAKNMEKTLSIPVFRVSREIATDKFDELYASLKTKGVSVSALLAKAVSEVLKKHPIMNAAYSADNGGSIKYNKDTNIAMAVAIDGGLITPTIVGAQNMDLFSVARKWKELVDKAKGKKLSPAEYSSGTFTISNLGMFGVQQFDAILPPNTGSILAIAAALPKVVQQKNGHFGVQKFMTVTITCDHRHIYGADAAEFLKDLADLLENNVHSLTMG